MLWAFLPCFQSQWLPTSQQILPSHPWCSRQEMQLVIEPVSLLAQLCGRMSRSEWAPGSYMHPKGLIFPLWPAVKQCSHHSFAIHCPPKAIRGVAVRGKKCPSLTPALPSPSFPKKDSSAVKMQVHFMAFWVQFKHSVTSLILWQCWWKTSRFQLMSKKHCIGDIIIMHTIRTVHV